MLPRKYRLPAKVFQNLYKSGFKAKGKYGMLISRKNNLARPLFGFVVSKKIGNSVYRHRMTRLLRAISMEAVKHFQMENMGISFSFVSFEFCNEYNVLKDEIFGLVEKTLSNELYEKNNSLVN